jgi:spore germination protein KB
MNTRISTKQLRYCAAGFILASSLLTSNLYYFARNDSWISVLIGFVISLGIIGLYAALAKRYPGLDLAEISEAVFGKVPGRLLTASYGFYFLSLTYFNTRDFGDFIKGMLLPSTPSMVVFIILIMTCAWAIRKGPVKMTRYGLLLTVIAITALLINAALLINKMEPKNFLPLLTLPPANYLIGAHIVTMLPLSEIMAFMMFIPYMAKPDEIGRAMRGGLIIGAATLLFIVLRDTLVLGRFNAIFSQPTFSTTRLIDMGDILTRLEIVYAVILMGQLFLKLNIVYFATAACVRALFGTSSYCLFTGIIGVLIVLYASASFPAMYEHVLWNLTAAATYSSFFLLFLPVLTLVVSIIRGGKTKHLTKPGEC